MFREGDVERTITRLHIDFTHKGKELSALCPMHKYRVGREDNNPSWSINAYTGAHHCFSCGYKGNLLTLVSDLLEYGDLEKARHWLSSNTEVDWDFVAKQLEEAKKTYIHLPKLVPMSEARLAVFSPVPEWAAKARGITKVDCEKYGVLWNEADSSWILPIRVAETGKLLGWQEKGQLSRRFMNRPTGIPKSKTLFGFNTFSRDQMIVVESPLDALKLNAVGIPGGVAVCGALISEEQIALMRQADTLVIALDNDETGKKASKDLLKAFRAAGIECWFFNYGDFEVKDIGDMTPDQIHWGIDNAKHCVLGEAAI